MKKIVIFGATGHVGVYLTKYAKEFFDSGEYEIIASGRRKADEFKAMDVQYIPVDICNTADFENLPQEDVYAVMMLAAQIPAYMNGYHPRDYIDSIISGTFNVLEYCRNVGVDRILFTTSTYDIWEYPEGTVIMPDMPKKFSYKGDHAVYVIAKNTAIELIEHYHQQYGLKEFIFRLPTVYSYSPNHYYYPNGVKTLRPIYRMIMQAKNSEDIELWGNPNYSKDMLHVYDLSQMLCKAVFADRDKGFYNCGTGIPVTLLEQQEAIIKVFSPKDNPSKIKYVKDKVAGGGVLMNVDNAKTELGYKPMYDCVALFEDFKKEMEKNENLK